MIDINIPNYCLELMSVLNNAGYECYLVGGCVRDSLMGNTPHDYDLTTNATPNQMLDCFKDYRIVETGLKHGTITVVIDFNNVEITTYRVDGEYKDNRHPSDVSFTTNLKDDLIRRDFTINAMAYNKTDGLVDLFDGLDDLRTNTIRCVGNADKRFNEDGLRILRAIRFSSVLGFDIEENTKISIHNNKELLKNISSERIYAEFLKLLCGKNVRTVLENYVDVIGTFIPEVLKCVGFEQKTKYHCYDVYKHIVETVCAVKPDKNLRLVCFLHDIGKPDCFFTDNNGVGHFYGHADVSAKIAKIVMNRFKADNQTSNFVVEAVKLHDREIEPTKKAVKRFLISHSLEFTKSLMQIKKADALAHSKPYRNRNEYLSKMEDVFAEIEEENSCFSLKSLAIDGDDLKELGIGEGKKIGEILNNLLNAVVDEKCDNNHQVLMNYVKEKYL